ncbi:HEAT repeat domain-containing protein, partial [Anabaena sp. UHCC 0399]|uniref:HEAT repeat domain-containing protein n=1 Tax=Anabaena sp. UHCC 0399 TaxID=3110238 RepID=UPI002B2076C9
AVASALGEIKDTRAVEPLIAKLNDADDDVQQAIETALVQLGNEETIETLLDRLSNCDNQHMRIMTLKALSWTCEDEIDRKLLSRDIYLFNVFFYMQEEIDEEQVRFAAEQLKISVEDVCKRYQKLARKFGLKLKFNTDAL